MAAARGPGADAGPVSRSRRILGVDPGLRVTGYGVIECHGGKLAYVASGCIRAGAGALPTRLGVIARDLAHLIAEIGPTEVAVERVFVNVNPNSTLLLGPGARRGHRRGRARRAAGHRVHRGAGEAGRRRRRPRGEDAGAGDGDAPARCCPARRSRTPRTRSPPRSATRMRRRASARWERAGAAAGCCAGRPDERQRRPFPEGSSPARPLPRPSPPSRPCSPSP